MLTGYQFENMSAVPLGRDGWRPVQTHVSLSAPSQCPISKTQECKVHRQDRINK